MRTNHRTNPVFAGAMLFATAAVSVGADYASTVLSHNPVAYWQYTEGPSSAAPFKLANSGSLGSVSDAYANSKVVNGAPGKVNNAIRLTNPGDTIGHVGSRADVVYNPGLNSPVFSIEFWANPSSLGGDATGLCPISNFNPNNYPGGRVGWLFYVNPSGRWNFRLGLTSGYAVNMVSSATNTFAAPNVWQHIVATYDGSVANLYINGALVATTNSSAASTGWVPNTGSFLRFGGTPLPGDKAWTTADGSYYLPWDQVATVSGSRGWDGWLDEVAIYTNALSGSTIAAHYAAAATPATYGATILGDHPAGYWNFDEPAVTAPTSFPMATNSGTLSSAADGTNLWGAVNGTPGPGYGGFPAGDKAVFFDGLNGYFNVNDAAGLHFTNNITLLAWVKPLADNYKHDIIEHGGDGLGAETFLRISRGSGAGYGTGNYYEMGASEGEQKDGWYDGALASIPPGDIGNWVFLAGTFDGANWNLYRNGTLVAQLPPYNNPATGDVDTGAVAVTNNWTIGSRALPSAEDGNRFAGTIAEPAIFTNALSAADILALYNAAQVPPVLTRALQNPGTVAAGSNVNLSVWAEGNPVLTYLWTSNGIATSVTTSNYSISNIQPGTYTIAVVVTNAYGTSSSSVTFNAVNVPPSISLQPISSIRIAGFPFNFSVTAGGTPPLTYYWMLGNNVVQTGAASNYAAIASLANAGSYTVMVSNVTGLNVTSAPAVLTVNPVPGGYGGAVVASGPMAFWRLDETNGSIAHDQIAGIDGTYLNATLGQLPGYSALDPNETAVAFSGLNSCVGKISGTAINFTGHTNFTLEAWVKGPAGLPNDSAIIAKGVGSDGYVHGEQFSLDVDDGVYRFLVANYSTYTNTAAYAADGPNGAWQHVVAVYDDQNTLGGGAKSYIYVNGELQGNGAVLASGLNGAVTTPVTIGSKRTGNDPNYDGNFNGLVSQVAVYSKALDASTILSHYAAAYGPITLTIQRLLPGTNIQLIWPAGSLQSATNVSGPYLTITNALSPFTTNSAGASRFFRVKL